MTREAFGQRLIDMQATLYRVAYGLLLNQNDCADAVQECIARAWSRQHTLRDAVVDEGSVAITLLAEPIDPEKHMLIGFDELALDYPDENSEKNYGEMAKETGKTLVLVGTLDFTVNGRLGDSGNCDFRREGDALVVYSELQGLGRLEGELAIAGRISDRELYGTTRTEQPDGSVYWENDCGEPNEAHMTFALDAEKTRAQTQTLRFEGPFPGELADVEWVEFKLTPLATHLRVRYTVHADLTDEQVTAMEFFNYKWMPDAQTTEFPESEGDLQIDLVGSGADSYYDGEGDYRSTPQGRTYVQYSAYGAVEALPEEIVLRPWYKQEGEWGEPIVIRRDAAVSDEEGRTVYMTYGGKFFHADEHCSGLEGAQAASEAEARLAGKLPCPVCVNGAGE